MPTAHAAHLLCCASTVFDQPSARVRVRLDAKRALSLYSSVLYAVAMRQLSNSCVVLIGALTVACGNVCATDVNTCVVCMSLIVHCCTVPPEAHANSLGAEQCTAASDGSPH